MNNDKKLCERGRFLLRDWDGEDRFHCFNISAPMVSQFIERIEALNARVAELEGALRKADDVVDQGPLIAWGKVETGPHEGGFMAIEYAGRNYYAEEVAQALSALGEKP